jgi:hypothetical protein
MVPRASFSQCSRAHKLVDDLRLRVGAEGAGL